MPVERAAGRGGSRHTGAWNGWQAGGAECAVADGLLNFHALLLSCSSMDASAKPCPAAARDVPGAGVTAAAVYALPHAANVRTP